MWGFSGKDNIDNRKEVQATRKMLGFIIGTSMFVLAIFRFIPKDLFTTASWLDRKGLGILYSTDATAFSKGSFWDITNVTVPVSEEAFWFAVMITVLQFAFGYLIGTSGSYTTGANVENPLQFLFMFAKGQVTAANVNWKKLGYWMTFIALAAFDTYTDWQFSSKFGQRDILVISLLYSLIVYNIASEFALMYGLQLAIGNAPDAVAAVITTVLGIISAPFGGRKSQPQGKPQLPHGQGKPQPPSNNQQRKDKQRNQQQQQRPQPPNGNGRVPFDPRTMPMPTMPSLLDDE
jgi:hypothetical protein